MYGRMDAGGMSMVGSYLAPSIFTLLNKCTRERASHLLDTKVHVRSALYESQGRVKCGKRSRSQW